MLSVGNGTARSGSCTIPTKDGKVLKQQLF
jgi:hypothetical protein